LAFCTCSIIGARTRKHFSVQRKRKKKFNVINFTSVTWKKFKTIEFDYSNKVFSFALWIVFQEIFVSLLPSCLASLLFSAVRCIGEEAKV